jgi:chaperonin GroES
MITDAHKEAGFTPMGDRVIIQRRKVEEKTAGGIILPSDLKDRRQMSELRAELIAIGELAFHEYVVTPKVGDMVKIAKFAGYTYENSDGIEYTIARDEEIVAFDRVIDIEEEIKQYKETQND